MKQIKAEYKFLQSITDSNMEQKLENRFLAEVNSNLGRQMLKVPDIQQAILRSSKYRQKGRRAAFEKKKRKVLQASVTPQEKSPQLKVRKKQSNLQKLSFDKENDKENKIKQDDKITDQNKNKTLGRTPSKARIRVASQVTDALNNKSPLTRQQPLDVISQKPIDDSQQRQLVLPPIKSSKNSKENSPSDKDRQISKKKTMHKRFNSLDSAFPQGEQKTSGVLNFKQNKKSEKVTSTAPKYSLIDKVLKHSMRASNIPKKLSERATGLLKSSTKKKETKSKLAQLKLQPIQKPVFCESVPDLSQLLKYFRDMRLQEAIKQNDQHDINNLNLEAEIESRRFRMLKRVSEQSAIDMQEFRNRIHQQILRSDLKEIYKYENSLIKNYSQTEHCGELSQQPLNFSSKITQQEVVTPNNRSISVFAKSAYLRKTFLGDVQIDESRRQIKRKLMRIRRLSPALFNKLFSRSVMA